jgi:putative transcriptional regulator
LDDNLAWGGDFETIKALIISGEINIHKIKFFIGYSGWSAGQLQSEIDDKTWITSEVKRNLIFEVPINNIWKQSVINLGGEFEQLAN